MSELTIWFIAGLITWAYFFGGRMRTLRQILHGCKKHHYVYFRDIKHFENAHRFGGFKTKLICRKCHHVENSNVDMMICRSALDEIVYGKLKHQPVKQ